MSISDGLLDNKITAVKMLFLDRREAEEFYEVYRNVVPEYSQMVSNSVFGTVTKDSRPMNCRLDRQ